MTVSTYTQPDNTTQSGATYKTNIDGDFSVHNRIAGQFAAHAQASPNMTVRVDAGSIFNGTTLTEVAAQNTGTITAPVTNPRIDRVVISKSAGTVSVITGSEGASPSAPSITAGNLPVAQVYLIVGQTSIVNADITDERQITSAGLVQATETMSGVLEVATAAETTTGTDDTRAITPLKLTTFAPASATFDTANDKIIALDATDSKLKQMAFPGGDRANWFGGNSGSNANSTQYYGGRNGDGTETNCQIPSPFTGTIKKLFARVTNAPGVGQSFVITVRKNASGTALTCTIADANTSASDTSNSFSVTAGDLLAVEVVGSAGAANNGAIGMSFQYEPTV